MKNRKKRKEEIQMETAHVVSIWIGVGFIMGVIALVLYAYGIDGTDYIIKVIN